MNDILMLKGHFEQRGGKSPGFKNIPKGKTVYLEHLKLLKRELEYVYDYWKNDKILDKKILTVYHDRILAKSNRIQAILPHPNASIIGAKFENKGIQKHIITYCFSLKEIREAIDGLETCINISNKKGWTIFSYVLIDNINKGIEKIDKSKTMSKTKFVSMIVDSFYIEHFGVEDHKNVNLQADIASDSLITIYDTGVPVDILLENIGITYIKEKSIDNTTLLLSPDQYKILYAKAPFLIAMTVSDMRNIAQPSISLKTVTKRTIPPPSNEPIIGVIDTLFDSSVYFSDWVEYQNMLPTEIPIKEEDMQHGTAVTSIIVDGPALNPSLDDGCGRFKVRHFGVTIAKAFSSFSILRAIKEIVIASKDIKVWNLSLGSAMEISKNFISPEAAILDKIQYENDVIFVIAGTNKNVSDRKIKYIGAPADSINSLVVNAVDFNNQPASYSRKGPVLSFFAKPDVCYYGGDKDEPMQAYTNKGDTSVVGSSFAAPWIARKLAYLIHMLGVNRELAKALIIDSAANWREKKIDIDYMGFGVVPKHIQDIVQTKNDEIKCMIYDTSDTYDMYNYRFPVPLVKDAYPYVAKAVLCYFSNCDRNQGVDYTNTELDLYFGRIQNAGKGIKTINNNTQSSEKSNEFTNEKEVRKDFRKWDNTRIICEKISTRNKARTRYTNPFWGISIKLKERINKNKKEKVKFGLIITLKEINGVNRIDEFIKNCIVNNWLVSRVNVQQHIDIYNQAEVDIQFEE